MPMAKGARKQKLIGSVRYDQFFSFHFKMDRYFFFNAFLWIFGQPLHPHPPYRTPRYFTGSLSHIIIGDQEFRL